MQEFKIYYGINKAEYQSTEQFETEDEALNYAYFEAISLYEAQADLGNVKSFDDTLDEIIDSLKEDEEISEMELYTIAENKYNDLLNKKVQYYVV